MKIKKYKFLIMVLFFVIALILYSVLFRFGIVIPCVFHELTGLYCPGCGVTRMMFSLLKLDFYQAFRYNNLVFLSIPLILFYFCDFIIKRFHNKSNYLYQKISDKVWIILLIITLLFGVLRNIPVFDYLIPTMV
jgi:nitrate reductase gamma subunit